MKLFTTSNPKTLKSQKVGWFEIILHLAPHTLSGYNTCKWSTEGCRTLCLNSSGFSGRFDAIQNKRIERTKMLFEDTENFLKLLDAEITYYKAVAKQMKMKLLVRLNGTSDIQWDEYLLENKSLYERHLDTVFINYTKHLNYKAKTPNHFVVYSVQQDTIQKGLKILENGGTIAGVFSKVPSSFMGWEITDGDEHDAIHLHQNKFLGLKYKNLTYTGADNKKSIEKNLLILN